MVKSWYLFDYIVLISDSFISVIFVLNESQIDEMGFLFILEELAP